MSTDQLLQIEDLEVQFGSSKILHGVNQDVDLKPLSILGRNGMGKTTLCAAILGLAPITKGKLIFKGKDITLATPEARAQAGIGYVPQGRRVFRSLSVHEHLQMMQQKGGEWTVDRVYETFPRLLERKKNLGDRLSGGEQQMLAISRALLLNPSLIILDEPTEGLAPAIVSDVIHLITNLADSGIGILLVEQNIHAAFAATKVSSIMVNGTIVKSLPTNELKSDLKLQKQFFGLEPGAALDKGDVG